MTRTGAILCALHLAITVWLASVTIHDFGDVPTWATVLTTIASLAPIAAIWRECDLRDSRLHVAALKERAAREQLSRNGRPLDQNEAADWQLLLARLDLAEPDDPRSST